MELVTLVEPVSDSYFNVFWRVGINRKGIVEVKVPQDVEDKDVIAELSAIKHLLFGEKVFNRDVVSGHGYTLIVSKGAIKKLAQNRSNKEHLKKYAAYFVHRLVGVEVVVSRNSEFMAKETDQGVTIDQITASPATHDLVKTPAIGDIFVTKHAIDRFLERTMHGKPKSPWNSVVKTVTNPDLVKIDLPRKVVAHKLKKYGPGVEFEIWKHPDNTTELLIIEEEGKKVLVSVYDRPVY